MLEKLSQTLTTPSPKVLQTLNVLSVIVPVVALFLMHQMKDTPLETQEQINNRNTINGLSIAALVGAALLVVVVPLLPPATKGNVNMIVSLLNLAYFGVVVAVSIMTLTYLSKNKSGGGIAAQNLSMMVQAFFWVFLALMSYKGLDWLSGLLLKQKNMKNSNLAPSQLQLTP